MNKNQPKLIFLNLTCFYFQETYKINVGGKEVGWVAAIIHTEKEATFGGKCLYLGGMYGGLGVQMGPGMVTDD